MSEKKSKLTEKEDKKIVKEEIVTKDVKPAKEEKEMKEEKEITSPCILQISKEAWEKKGTRVCLMSRIDYPSPGFRSGLVRLALEKSAELGVHLNVLTGGLVDKDVLKRKLQVYIDDVKDDFRADKHKFTAEDREEYEDRFCHDYAKELAEIIPKIKKPSGELIKLYILTSRAYDGEIGGKIARKLTELRRDDIVYWGESSELPLFIKYVNKLLQPVVPKKQSWRSDYYSTPVDRERKDIEKLSSKLPDIQAFGCFASSVLRPRGESRRAYFSLPALHKLLGTKTSENQIGIRILNLQENNNKDDKIEPGDGKGEFSVETYSFKDLISEERKLIKAPPSASKLQSAIVDQLITAPMSVGMLEYFLREHPDWKNMTREEIKKEIENLKRFRVGIELDKASQLYDFKPDWFQKKAVFTLLPEKDLIEDCFVGVGCPHVGANQTNYRFIVEDTPRYILEKNARFLIGGGDFVQGTEHHLVERKQVYRGLNDTEQEILSAGLFGDIIAKVFGARLREAIKGKDVAKLTQEELKNIISDALLTFIYIAGNHDVWVKNRSITPLVVFRKWLIDFIIRDVKAILKENNLHVDGVHSIVVSKVIEDHPIEKIFFTTPSGLAVKLGHPFTARNLTASISSERFFAKYLGSHVNFTANFHVALYLEHFDQEIGQRVLVQLPTIQKYTEFEDGKMKKTDFGIGFCRVKSYKGRIIISEAGFYGERGDIEKVDNDIIDQALVKAGIPLR